MNEHLWAGADLKLGFAAFHFDRMCRSFERPNGHYYAAQLAAGVIVDAPWRRVLAAHLDALLGATRAIPEVIGCCFGRDKHWYLKEWFAKLPAEEQSRRRQFRQAFVPHFEAFDCLPLSRARHASFHRAGYPQFAVEVVGAFGGVHRGNAVSPLPSSEIRPISDPELAWLNRPKPIEPSYSDFTIDGRPLFDECQRHLEAASALIAAARSIAQRVHGNESLTDPPD